MIQNTILIGYNPQAAPMVLRILCSDIDYYTQVVPAGLKTGRPYATTFEPRSGDLFVPNEDIMPFFEPHSGDL
jgi:hypothetical protein